MCRILSTLVALMLLLALAGLPHAARGDEPKGDCDEAHQKETHPLEVLGLGLLMAPPTYLLGVTWHEGSHALAVKAMGGNVTEFSIWPRKHPIDGHLTFGHTVVNSGRWCEGGMTEDGVLIISSWCPFTRDENLTFLLAPKGTDALMMGGFIAADMTDNLPDNLYARIAITSLAVGAWVDFSKDLLSTSKYNDMNKVYTLLGEDYKDKSNPYAMAYLGLSVASGIGVGRGVYRLLTDPDNLERKGKARKRATFFVSPSLVGVQGQF